jgi:hypothetical protein
MGKIVLDRRGDIRKRVYYEFNVPFDDATNGLRRGPDWIVVPRTPTNKELESRGDKGYVWAECLREEEDQVETNDCRVDSTHVTHRFFKAVSADLAGQSKVSPLLPNTGVSCLVMSEELHKQFEPLRVKGGRIDSISINVNQSSWKDPKLWALQFVGRAAARIPKLEDVANACPHCGRGKIVCESCGRWNVYCKSCGKEMVVIETKHAGERDKRVPFEPDPSSVIEGKSWDGSDLIQVLGRPYASKRFIDWLMRIHAAPFYAEPVYFCVDGMSDDQQRWFKELEKPLT